MLFAINRLTRPSFGLPAPYVHCLYMAVVIPKVEYVLPVWYMPLCASPSGGRTHGSVGHTTAIGKLQRLACKLITGAFKSAPLDTIKMLAYIPPIQIRLANTCYHEVLRLCTPPVHPRQKCCQTTPLLSSFATTQPNSCVCPQSEKC